MLSAAEIKAILDSSLDERTRKAFGMFFNSGSGGLTLDGKKIILTYNETWNILMFYINCVEQTDTEVIESLLAHGASLHFENRDRQTPLLHAIKLKKDPSLIRYLLEKGSALNHCDHQGCWALIYIIKAYDADLIALFLEKGSQV